MGKEVADYNQNGWNENGSLDSEEEQAKKEKRNTKIKGIMQVLFSHVGLCLIVIIYSVIGGAIFQHLEATNEKDECIQSMDKYQPIYEKVTTNVWEIAKVYADEYLKSDSAEIRAQALVEFDTIVAQFRSDVLELGYDGKNCTIMGEPGGPGQQWSFPASLMFAVTIITTIGYGNIAPKTFWGRLVCIAYATLGIPLMLLCLANIGDVMADIFRFVYSNICCCGCCRKKETKVKSLKPDGDARAQTPEAWKKDYSGQKQGLPPSQDPVIIEDDEDEEEEEEPISVPLTITMGVIAFFIFMGALLFGTWEEWPPLDASYFCFVTISTIGFGDLVPGSAHFENTEDKYKMIFSAVYMMFGMAILSMCFSLIQEEIVAKFKWVGEKIGIIEKNKDDGEELEGDEEDEDDEPDDPQTPPPKKR